MPTINDMTGLLDRYMRACETRETERIVECFAADAVIEDPLRESVRGREEIGEYFDSIYADLGDLKLEVSHLYWCRNAAACRWIGHATRRDGTRITYEGIDVLVIDEGLKIARMSAYWDPKDFV